MEEAEVAETLVSIHSCVVLAGQALVRVRTCAGEAVLVAGDVHTVS